MHRQMALVVEDDPPESEPLADRFGDAYKLKFQMRNQRHIPQNDHSIVEAVKNQMLIQGWA